MPQLKIPATLYTLCLHNTRLWILNLANLLYQTHGDYDSIECRSAVSQFNHYLSHSVPVQIIDELYNSSDLVAGTKLCVRSRLPPLQNQLMFDPRIIIAMFINVNMKIFTAHSYVNDNFWKVTLLSLNNLVRLNLNKVCTDEILEVVGKHCRGLEFVNIVSKSCHARSKDRHNALRLQMCVSDVGLNFLSNCKELKEIVMSSIIRRGCGGRQITYEGLKQLLLSLPKLRRINYTDLGILLDYIPEDSEKLSIVSLVDHHPNALRILKMEKLCPNLTELHFTHAYSSGERKADLITALTASELKITNLVLNNYPFDNALKHYLEKKGSHLVSFHLNSGHIQSFPALIQLLGWACPNLQSLGLYFNLLDGVGLSEMSFDSNDKCFSKLKSLVIEGVYWKCSPALLMLLKHAVSIEKVVLNNYSCSFSLDEVLQQIQLTNDFHNLQTVTFLRGIDVSFHCLTTFVLSCPLLKSLTVWNKSQDYCNSVAQFWLELLAKNYDVNIEVLRCN